MELKESSSPLMYLVPNYFKMLKYNQYLHLNAFKDPRQQNSLGTAGVILCTIYSPGVRAETMPSFPKSGLWDLSQPTEERENSPDLHQPQAELYPTSPRAKGHCHSHSSHQENPSPGDPRAASLGPLELSHLTPSWTHSFHPALLPEDPASKTLLLVRRLRN